MIDRRNADVSSRPALTVRVGSGYALKFIITLGQRNARFVQKRFFPLHRMVYWGDAVELVPKRGYDLIHAFNSVPLLTSTPYIVTFEDFMPRVPEDRHVSWLEEFLQKQLCDRRCLAIIAMSEYARRQCLWQNRFFSGLENLRNKLRVIYPAIASGNEVPKRMGNELRLIFAGGVHMRKGLPALLRAHQQLRKQGIPARTTVISGLDWTAKDYVGPPSRDYVDEQNRLLAQEGVEYHFTLSYPRMMNLIRDADYLVFPTFHDTFGLVSLDALSCGTPVIATATCAQPEIIEDGVCGYLLPFENDPEVGKWVWLYRNRDPGYLEAYEQTIRRLTDALVVRLTECWNQRAGYEALSAGALRQIRTKFNSETARDTLETLYERARAQA